MQRPGAMAAQGKPAERYCDRITAGIITYFVWVVVNQSATGR